MPAAEPMTQEIVERLKELLAKATPGPWFSSRYRRALGSQVWAGKPGPGVILICGDGDAEDVDADLIVFLRNNADALLSTLTNLTPSGVEREAYREGLRTAARMVRRFMGDQYGENSALLIDVDEGIQADKPTLAYVAEALERRALALPSEPPSQGDVEL